MKNVSLAGLALTCLFLKGCFMPEAQTNSTSSLKGNTPLIFSENKPTFEETYLVINQGFYRLPDVCQSTRLHGDQADQRLLGDQADQRMLGDQADSRLHGDQADQRMLGDQADSRLHGDQADQRMLGDQADSRLHGDQADQRMLGDQADSRLHGDQADQRMLGDQADSRLHGDQADQRMLGDQADSRLHGSQVSQFKCSKIASLNGVVISGFTGSEQVVVNKGSQFGSYSWSNNALILKF